MEQADKKKRFPARYYLLGIVLMAASLGLVIYGGRPNPPQRIARAAYFYKDPSIDISRIKIKAFYAIPKNKAQEINPLWRQTITSALDQIVKFHAVQFRGLSEIKYNLFPQPVFLRNDDSFYDTTSTGRGNPRGLVGVAQEIDERVFREGGDLYDKDFAKLDKSEYPVMGLIYEGVGASGGVIYETELKTAKEIAEKLGVEESIVYIVDIGSVRGFFLLNNQYLTDDQYNVFGPTLLYHEFSHTIGLPDRFDENDSPFANDVTGGGRHEPIEATYIDRDLLKDLGVIPN